jgi:hypothetical protein
MPTWGAILSEIQAAQAVLVAQLQAGQPQRPGAPSPFDIVRRKYLALLAQYTGRSTIVYSTKWTQFVPDIAPELVSIVIEDVQGFMEAMHDLPDNRLDLILHSPGGSAEAAEALVTYLRSKFTDIRVFVPHAAMSAATMLACAASALARMAAYFAAIWASVDCSMPTSQAIIGVIGWRVVVQVHVV